ncbi:hypothetical protein [Aurantiacibacter gangjinensis]|uniref:Uncharacterized protein n=1 Tax=Aurantiacibacter gangjinensis TaxID=502682 RepID=A0A0G9MR08_9SPHN|nr:hypothetical protein [Aurantiacibacter gangjinensis]APE27751.1 hypothetical protein BMF35_a0922 [Aurantiacibacter gangjinensis]KLE31748.1 hypothetical protein AAW01_09590 [Aurantiacibacter gangjinensis]
MHAKTLSLAAASACLALAACASTPPPPAPVVDHYRPTSEAAQLEEVRAAVERYRDFRAAERDGWEPFGDDEPLMGRHYHNSNAPDYVHGDALDFSRPNNLMYTEIDGEMVLTGVAFVVRLGEGEPVPQGFAGSRDRWHVHDFVAAIDAATEERPIIRWLANRWLDDNYRNNGDMRGRLAMVHAWVTLDNPDGIYADYNRTLPYLKLGLPHSYWHGASEEAARGLNLATEGGCEAQNGTLWIADTSRRQNRTIAAACEEGANMVRGALGEGPQAVNRAGERAWAHFDGVWQTTLTEEQRARVAAMSEHGSDGHGDHEGHGGHEGH